MKNVMLSILIMLILSCTYVEKEYYGNGTLKKDFRLKDGKLHGSYKEYYDNGKLKIIHNYSSGKNIDSSIYFYSRTNENIGVKKYWLEGKNYYQKEFYPNGNIKKEGMILDSIFLIDNWKFYNEEGILNEIRNYKKINNDTYLNQIYNLSKDGDTLNNGSNFIKILLSRDTVKLNEPMRAVTFLRSPFFKGNESQISVYLAHNNDHFYEDFLNQDIIEKDTFYNLTIDTINQKWYKDFDHNRVAVFGKWFNSIGNKNVRGYVSEFYKRKPTEKDSSTMKERRIYFDIPIYVKDSIN